MRLTSTLSKLAAFAGLATSVTAFNPSANDNVVVYWGQASAGSQEDLSYYCASDDVDVVIVSFLTSYDNPPTLNFAGSCSETFSNGLLKCDKIASDIKTCQAAGKKVLLSLGGATSTSTFSGDSDAEAFATTLWNLFGEGTAEQRPFGDAIVDGFDFDIENKQQTGYVALATKLREYFASSSRDYYLAAAPQCVYPDESLSELLEGVDIDFAYIQFYNNYCNVDKQFNWDTWVTYAETVAPNKNIKLYLGLPGGQTGAGSGYVGLDTVKSTLATIASTPQFGGIMLWDASQGFTNQVDGGNFVSGIKNALKQHGSSPKPTSKAPVASSAVVLSSASAPATVQTAISAAASAAVASSATTSTSSIVWYTPATSNPVNVAATSTSSIVWYTPVASNPVDVAATSTSTSSIVWYTPTTTSTSSPIPVLASTATSVSVVAPASPVAQGTSTATVSKIATILSVKNNDVDPVISNTKTNTKSKPVVTSTTSIYSKPPSKGGVSTAIETSYATVTVGVSASETSSPVEVVSSAANSTSSFVEVTTNSFTAQLSTLITAVTSATPSGSVSSGCSNQSGQSKVDCLNAQYEAGQFAGSPDACTEGEASCSADGSYAVCVYGSWVIRACSAGTSCYAALSGDNIAIGCDYTKNV